MSAYLSRPVKEETASDEMLSTDFLVSIIEQWMKQFKKNAKLMSTFRSCNNDAERFHIVWEFLEGVQPNTVLIGGNKDGKSASEAAKIRKLSCDQFMEGKHELAILGVNDSLLRSPWPTSNEDFTSPLLLGLERRAEMFFMMKKFDECVQDIDNIAFLGLADRRHLDKLRLKKVKALKASKRFKEAAECVADEDFVLEGWNPEGTGDGLSPAIKSMWVKSLADYAIEHNGKVGAPIKGFAAMKEKLKNLTPKNGFHPVLKSASALVELKYTQAAGRHLVATGDFNTGDVVMVDPSFVSCVEMAKWATHCVVCTMATDTPIPCRNCTWVVFCSNACAASPKAKLHEKECKLLPIISSSAEPDSGSLNHPGLRRIMVLRTLLMKSAHEWRAFAARYPGNLPGEADEFAVIPNPKKYQYDDYANIFCLLKNSKKMHAVELLKEAFNACFIVKVLEQGYSPLDEYLRKFLGGLALRHMVNYAVNAEETCEFLVYPKEEPMQPKFSTTALAVYPTYALCNYSCFPNLSSTFLGDVMVVRARRPIKKGDVLFTSTASCEFLTSPLHARHEFLKKNHHFICKCPGCVYNWPSRVQIFHSGLYKEPHKVKCLNCSHVIGDVDTILDTEVITLCSGCGVTVDFAAISLAVTELTAVPLKSLKGKALYEKVDKAWAVFRFPCTAIVEYENQALLDFASEGNKFLVPKSLFFIGGTVKASGDVASRRGHRECAAM